MVGMVWKCWGRLTLKTLRNLELTSVNSNQIIVKNLWLQWERLYNLELTSNQIFIKKLWLGMMGKAGAEKRPSQSLALHCSDRCALQKEKDKDKCTTYRDKKGEYKDRFTIHYAETKRNI